MLQEQLINFVIVTLGQLLFFLFHAYKVGELSNTKTYLTRGMIIGLPLGLFTDLTFGYWLGLWDYSFNYAWWSLIMIGTFSYGFMVANVFLLARHNPLQIYIWSIGLAVVYESINYFFPVWEWTFATNPIVEYLSVTFILYAVGTVVMMTTMRLAYKTHFRLLPF